MEILAAASSVIVILVVLLDAFETMLLPRRVKRQFRIARFFYVYSWMPWAAVAGRLANDKRRNTFLSIYGPLSILVLIGLWATGLILGFAMMNWSLGTLLKGEESDVGLGVYAYLSGVTFFTLGYGDLAPAQPLGRFLAVVESGIGFGFLAVVISYLPVLYQAFSKREVTISLLDARAGSPPSAVTLLERFSRRRGHGLDLLDQFLGEWERWAAEMLESHISFPVLSYYRSQHDNQSWLAALTAILDTSALIVAGLPGSDRSQAWLTLAMGRHVAVDLCQVFNAPPVEPETDRFPLDSWRGLRDRLREAGLEMQVDEVAGQRLAELRGMYEPFVVALSRRFLMPIPSFVPSKEPVDNWQTSAWMRRTRGIRLLKELGVRDEHDD